MIHKSELKIERIRGKGPGGQNKNKVSSCIRITHKPTGIQVTQDGRDQHKNLALAIKELERRLKELKEDKKAAARKERRDAAIHDETIIRTYDFKKRRVKDHRTKKSADLDSVLYKGRIDLIR
jgi:peptide chain release factor 1